MDSIRLSDPLLTESGLYWLESRPSEKGRATIMKRTPEGVIRELLPPPYNATSRVHEYGGGAWTPVGNALYFVNFSDQRIYCARGGQIQPLTAAGEKRFADLTAAPDGRTLYAICEDHSGPGEPDNRIVAVNIAGENQDGQVRTLAEGQDFYAAPRPSPDGKKLAWLCWNHPQMPWDCCYLCLASRTGQGNFATPEVLAGGPVESIFQPEWSPDGLLHFVSDRSGWWNLYRLDPNHEVVPLAPMAAEFGLPMWQFGLRTYGFSTAGYPIATYVQDGAAKLVLLARDSGPQELKHGARSIAQPCVHGDRIAFVAGYEERGQDVVLQDLSGRDSIHAAQSSRGDQVASCLSRPQTIEFPTNDGQHGHAFYYPPTHSHYRAPAGEAPPLIVTVHGGPTTAASPDFNPKTQFWTSRGFAVVDVNYGGSTGYGRAYRERLRGLWGITDVDDCVAAARYLVEQGLADPARLCIRGGSAGGYSALAALAFRDLFKAGVVYYGIGDLETLVRDTHKFESHYLDGIVGPYPQAQATYRARSPIHAADQIRCPVLFFQGLQDRVVPPGQAEDMVAALRRKGTAVTHITFPEEGHGFRRADTISAVMHAELSFYGQVFGLASPIAQ